MNTLPWATDERRRFILAYGFGDHSPSSGRPHWLDHRCRKRIAVAKSTQRMDSVAIQDAGTQAACSSLINQTPWESYPLRGGLLGPKHLPLGPFSQILHSSEL